MDIICKNITPGALGPVYDENHNLIKIFAAEDVFISPDERKTVSTGIAFVFPDDVGLMFFPPSELTSKTGLRYDYPNHAFVLQNNYYHQEELKIRFKNSCAINADAKRVCEYKLIDGTIVSDSNNLYNEGTVKICKGDCIALMKQVPAFYDDTADSNINLSVKVTKKSGDEAIKSENGKVVSSMKDFWSWAYSNLVSNTQRGTYAEYLVSIALGAEAKMKTDWGPYDILAPGGIKIEVKSSAYLQAWEQKRHSKIIFGISPSHDYDYEKKGYNYNSGHVRHSHVYVFCVETCKDPKAVDPLDLSQWEFYVISTKQINECLGSHKTVTLDKLKKIGAEKCAFEELKQTVYGKYDNEYGKQH